MPAVEIDPDDLALLVYAAVAFNMGITSRRTREPEAIERLHLASRRVGALVGIEIADLS